MSRETINVPFAPRNAHTVAVTLEPSVIERVTAFATQIELANRKRGRKNKQGLTAKGKESLALRVRGYCGEAAVAVHLGLEPVRLADEWRGRPDVLCFDVITTDKAHGALIVTPRDRLDMMKVLVIDRSPVFHIAGWYGAGDARLQAQRQHSEWWRTEREKGGAWYVPQAFLKPLNDPEALFALVKYARAWSEKHGGFILLKNGSKIELVPDDGQGFKGLEITHSEIDGMSAADKEKHHAFWEDWHASLLEEMPPGYVPSGVMDRKPEIVTDWREVLRRAGAAPPHEETHGDSTEHA